MYLVADKHDTPPSLILTPGVYTLSNEFLDRCDQSVYNVSFCIRYRLCDG